MILTIWFKTENTITVKLENVISLYFGSNQLVVTFKGGKTCVYNNVTAVIKTV